MKRISFVLLTLFFGGISHSVHAIPLELHGLRPFPNIFIQFSDQIEEGEENVASLEEVRAREEEVILRYSKDPSGQSTSKYSDDTSTTQSALKYPNEGSSVMAQSELKYSHDDPSIVAEPTLKYPHNLTQMLLKIPVVVVQPKLKYPHDDPSVVTQPALKYPHDDPSVVVQPALKYPHDDPSVVVQPALKYPHDDPSVVVQPALKYPHDDPSVVVQPALKYPHDDPSVVTQPALKYPHDDPSVVTQPELKYPHNLTQMLLKIPVVVVRPELKYPYDDPSVVAQPELKYSHDDPSVAAQTALRYSQAAAKYPPASRSPLIEWNDPDFLNILYKKEVHLYEWDEKTRDSWIQKIDEHLQKDICLDLGDDCLETFQVGSLPNAKFAVIFVHGAIDYKKHLGVNDIGFGGNFNFLKNLVLRNEGVYFSPSFQLHRSEIELMQKLISHIKSLSPQAKIAFACGSSGMVICSGIAENLEEMAVDGLVFLGGSGTPRPSEDLPFFASRKPIIMAHASYDGWEHMKRFYDSVKEMDSQYPIQFQLYHGGVHGTPIRMIDWQRSLNYLFLNSPDSQSDEINTVLREGVGETLVP